jgi:hypothetical protein
MSILETGMERGNEKHKVIRTTLPCFILELMESFLTFDEGFHVDGHFGFKGHFFT